MVARTVVLVWCLATPAFAQISDQHSAEGIAAALAGPLSAEAIEKAREFDDQLLSEGRTDEQRVYLVTDKRSRKVNGLTEKLLTAMGSDPKAWVVRVLDTNPPVNNAFVAGGQYIYVFTGFLSSTKSDDEVAFVLGHELGHSLLKHEERSQNDFSQKLAQLALLFGAIAKGDTAGEIGMFGQVLNAQYSQQDEAEADALGAAIALRAGFDPLRGADFFTRNLKEREAAAPGALLSEAELQAIRADVLEAQNECQQMKPDWFSSADSTNKTCTDAENRRLAFNKANTEFQNARMQESTQALTGSHPSDQSRVATLAATTDFLAGRRNMSSIAKFETAHNVMQALNATNSVLLRPADVVVSQDHAAKAVAQVIQDDMTVRLQKLKTAFDSGLISQEEYDGKRKDILSQL